MRKNVFLTSLVITVLIFSSAMLINYSLDFFRLGSIIGVMKEHEISSEAYLTEESFIEAFGGNKCATLNNRIELLKKEIKDVGIELSGYGRISFFKKEDYDYLERKYFLLELKFLASIEKLNRECNMPYIPIIFFYKADDDLSERQGYILSELSEEYDHTVVVISLDKDYKKEPLVKFLVEQYNITNAPTTVIAGQIRHERLVYAKELRGVIEKLLGDSDFYGSGYDFGFVLDRTGDSRQVYARNASRLLGTDVSDYAKGDINLILGRLNKNDSQICSSIPFYDKALALASEKSEERAILYETIASLGCGRNKRDLLLNASKIWAELGNDFRANLDFDLAEGNEPELKFSILPLEAPKKVINKEADYIIIGNSSITLTKEDKIISHTDRVTRDWLSYLIYSSPFSENLLRVFYERFQYPDDELLVDIGWHEGGRIAELKEIGLSHEIAAGTVVAEKDGKWYAPDENGIFKFEVPLDKLFYPTTRFLRENIAIIIDTHGINMLVEQAIRKGASVVIGCCDHPGKIKAAQYLAEKGINSICFTDKYLPWILGANQTILGSPPIDNQGARIIIGSRPVQIPTGSTIIAADVTNYENIQSYYDTPARYFRELEKMAELNIVYVPLKMMNQTDRITDAARENNANFIGVRIYNSYDYKEVKEWLEEDEKNTAVLFHSMSYPFGYKLMHEFPGQTTFDDINPIII